MKTTLKTLLLVAMAVGLQFDLQAQNLKMPQASTTQTLTQAFGLGTISINYSRPNVKGRKIFGGLEPYDAVWRTGANSATTIAFTRIPYGNNSTAHSRVNALRAPLEAA